MSPERKQIILQCQTNPENAAQTLVDMQNEITELRRNVEELTATLEYVAGPMMLGDDPTMGYHSQAIAYIEAALKQEVESDRK